VIEAEDILSAAYFAAYYRKSEEEKVGRIGWSEELCHGTLI